MNQLKMDIQQAISALSRSGWSQRRIARELDIDRETVARYRQLARQAEASNPALCPPAPRPRRARPAIPLQPQNQPFRPRVQAGSRQPL